MRGEAELNWDVVECEDGVTVIAELYRGEDHHLGNLDVTLLTPTERDTLRRCFEGAGGSLRIIRQAILGPAAESTCAKPLEKRFSAA